MGVFWQYSLFLKGMGAPDDPLDSAAHVSGFQTIWQIGPMDEITEDEWTVVA